MFRKVILAAALLLAPLSCALSPATASNLTIKDGTQTTQYLCAKTLADGSLAECNVELDSGLNVIDPATKQYQISILTALGSPFQAGGSIGNTSFGISGTLPAFAAPPTVNLGTLNGAALGRDPASYQNAAGDRSCSRCDAPGDQDRAWDSAPSGWRQRRLDGITPGPFAAPPTVNLGASGIGGSLGSPLYISPVVAGPTLANQALSVSAEQATAANTAPSGLGVTQLVPTTGTVSVPVAIGTPATGTKYVRILPETAAGVNVTVAWTKATSASAAASQFAAGAYSTVSMSATGPNWDEPISLTAGTNIYVGPVSGAATFSFE